VETPILTVEQKQSIQLLALQIENAQLRAHAAQTDFDRSRGDMSALLKSLQRDGFNLDLQSLAYVAKPAEAPSQP